MSDEISHSMDEHDEGCPHHGTDHVCNGVFYTRSTPAPVTDAQREALEPRAYLHTCESGSSLFHTKVCAEQKMRQWGGKVLPLYAALSAPVAQVDVEALIAAYWFINASEKELKEIGKDRVYWLKEFHRLCPSMPHLTPKTQEAEG